MSANRAGKVDGKSAARRRAARHRQAPPPRQWWQGPWLVAAAVAIIIIAVAVFVFIGRQETASSNLPSGPELTTIQSQVTHISPDVFNAVGTGGLQNPLKPTNSTQPLNGPGQKPEVLYIGAEFCPYCASERWSLIAALSRFGDFQNLEPTTSMSNDVFPNTPTFSFAHSPYTSSAIDFVPVETRDRAQRPLQQPAPEQQALMTQFDPPGSIPFVDIANKYVTVGSGYDTGVINGKDWKTIATALADPNDPITRSIVGNANYLTAAICQATNGQPSAVCSSPAVSSISSQLGG